MKRILSIIILLTVILSTIVLPGCKDDVQERWNSKLENTYLLDTPLSRFFIDNGNKKTLNSYVKVYILGENNSLDIDFFSSKYIKNIENVTYTYRVRQNPYTKDDYIRCTEYTLELHKDTKLNLLYVAYKMSKLPNVFTVDALVEGDWLCAKFCCTLYEEF